MSAELLRRAAKTLREHAEVAIGGSWVSLDLGDRLISTDDDGSTITYLVTEEPTLDGPTAAYIALMHPPVALALAEWFEDFAVYLDKRSGEMWPFAFTQGFQVARAILREDS